MNELYMCLPYGMTVNSAHHQPTCSMVNTVNEVRLPKIVGGPKKGLQGSSNLVAEVL